jgi:hypothetical protein
MNKIKIELTYLQTLHLLHFLDRTPINPLKSEIRGIIWNSIPAYEDVPSAEENPLLASKLR